MPQLDSVANISAYILIAHKLHCQDMSQAPSPILKVLDSARRKLLETGTRNRLVHVNRENTKANCLNIINELSDEVYRSLRENGRRMRFKALGQDRKKDSEGDDIALAISPTFNVNDPARQTDDMLETPLGPETLARRLLRLATDARTAEEEQGLNILFLAQGFLRWKESGSSEVVRQAPLVLLPVELVRNERSSTYDIRIRDDDLTTNLPLQERLRQDFGVTLPEIDETEAWSPSSYFEMVGDAISSQKGWSIDRDGMQLGFFSFAKLLMHHDLDLAKWPDDSFEHSNLLRGLLMDGFEDSDPVFADGERLDRILDPADIIQVVDADASQTKVIEEVRRGADLVVQGPPGTGKSQTITNLLAAAAHDGKTVLFVAEKMAALSVVHDRLVKSGLGDVCLELHSRTANKKALAQELGRTLAASGRPIPPALDTTSLRVKRDDLNAIADMLHQPMEPNGESPFDAMSEMVGYLGQGIAPPSISLQGLDALGPDARRRGRQALETLVAALVRAGDPKTHPFRGTKALDLQPTDLSRLTGQLAEAVQALDHVQVEGARLAQLLDIPAPRTLGEASALAVSTLALSEAPGEAAARVDVLFDIAEDPRLADALAIGEAWRLARESASSTFGAAAWPAELAEMRKAIVRGQGSFLSRLFGPYRGGSAMLASLLAIPLPKEPAARLALVDQLLDIQQKRGQLANEDAWLQPLLKSLWRGERTPFGELLTVCQWIAAVKAGGSFNSAERLSGALGRLPDPAAVSAALTALGQSAATHVEEVRARLMLDPEEAGLAEDLSMIPLIEMRERLEAMRADISRYGDWVGLRSAANAAIANGASAVVSKVLEGTLAADRAVAEFAFACAEARWNAARRLRPELEGLKSIDRHRLVAEFGALERERIGSTRNLIRQRHAARMPKGSAGEMAIIRGEIARKRGHKSIRWLMQNAGSMIQRIKPIILMSPISVAQFLPPGAVTFDLLVIDEASQIKPEDALGCIARARQIVVVGDQKQLPPTSFFDRLVDDAEIEEDDEMPPGASATDMESILTLCEARGINRRMLTWHYRSRDPSLIRISNVEFYEDQLVLPPSPLQLDQNYGLKLNRVPGVYAPRNSGLGRAGTNRIEAEAVAKAIAEHARQWPELSLGVVAFSKTQSDMLTEVLENERRKDQILDAFLRAGRHEDLFVKNIENVQGDERDVILISVGYGPQEAGGRLNSMSFGPVNGEGGGRRLNVLFSRARVRCEVFASFDPADIDPTRTVRDGPRILKRFLDFAKTGILDDRKATGLEADSPFEEDVAAVVRSLGFEADPQVGSAGFRVDMGVRHPDRPAQYILAVECDGAAYHSALWARERDRLRQDILENLGWKFHRIWSTDWFHRRGREIERLRVALEDARAFAESGIKVKGANAGGVETQALLLDHEPPGDAPIVLDHLKLSAPKYVRAELHTTSSAEPHEAPIQLLADLVEKIVSIEGPIHIDEVARRISAAFGKSRTGSRINSATDVAAATAMSANSNIRKQGDFLATTDQLYSPPVRDRSSETGNIAKAQYLPPVEIAAAARLVIEENGLIEKGDLVKAIAQLLGFLRLGPELSDSINKVVEEIMQGDVGVGITA